MGLGRRKRRQDSLWIATDELRKRPTGTVLTDRAGLCPQPEVVDTIGWGGVTLQVRTQPSASLSGSTARAGRCGVPDFR